MRQVHTAGEKTFVDYAGQRPSLVDPTTGAIIGTTIQEQTRQCLTNIQAILRAAGSSLDKIVSVTIVLADEDDFAGHGVHHIERNFFAQQDVGK